MVELRHPHEETWLDARLREWWPMLEEYYQRQIQSAIEVAILLDEPARSSREPLKYKEMWKKFIADFRPPKSPHTIKYHCDKCKAQNVKLWRGVHGCAMTMKGTSFSALLALPQVRRWMTMESYRRNLTRMLLEKHWRGNENRSGQRLVASSSSRRYLLGL